MIPADRGKPVSAKVLRRNHQEPFSSAADTAGSGPGPRPSAPRRPGATAWGGPPPARRWRSGSPVPAAPGRPGSHGPRPGASGGAVPELAHGEPLQRRLAVRWGRWLLGPGGARPGDNQVIASGHAPVGAGRFSPLRWRPGRLPGRRPRRARARCRHRPSGPARLAGATRQPRAASYGRSSSQPAAPATPPVATAAPAFAASPATRRARGGSTALLSLRSVCTGLASFPPATPTVCSMGRRRRWRPPLSTELHAEAVQDRSALTVLLGPRPVQPVNATASTTSPACRRTRATMSLFARNRRLPTPSSCCGGRSRR
jgi:hypothetical protein